MKNIFIKTTIVITGTPEMNLKTRITHAYNSYIKIGGDSNINQIKDVSIEGSDILEITYINGFIETINIKMDSFIEKLKSIGYEFI